ncbi:MAG: hypothetical protein AAF869_01770 [Pseudomonadota bacterium]
MTMARAFQFERVFDGAGGASGEPVAAPRPAAPAPVAEAPANDDSVALDVHEEALERAAAAARAEGFEEGVKRALEQAAEHETARLSDALESVAGQLADINAHKEETLTMLETRATRLALSVIKRLAAGLTEQLAADAAQRLAARIARHARRHGAVTVTAHPEMAAALRDALIDAAPAPAPSSGQDDEDVPAAIDIRENPNLATSDVRVGWDFGGFDYNPADVGAEIQALIDEAAKIEARP